MFDWSGDSDGVTAGSFRLGAGGAVEWATWGPLPSTAPTIVLLHEGLGCIRLWRGFPQALAKATGCGVFAYSRLGYGGSSPVRPPLPVTRMADEATSVLPQLIDVLNPKQLILLGHSDGGTIAAHYLAGATHPALKAAVLMSPHFFCEPSNVSAIKATVETYRDGDLRRRLAKYHDDVDGAFYGWAETWLNPQFANWDMRGDLANWRHLVLFIQGADDPYGSQGQADAAASSRHVEIISLENCAHSPHLEQVDRTLGLVAKFVAKALDGER